MVFSCYGKAGGRHHYSRNCTYVLHECNGRTGYTSINRSVVPLGLDHHNWFRLAGPTEACFHSRSVEGSFGSDIDYAQIVKIYGAAPEAFKAATAPQNASAPVNR